MYSDIFDQLGVAPGGGGGNAASSSNEQDEKDIVLRVKAGRVTLDWQKDKYYECKPQPDRGEIRLVVKNDPAAHLYWQWYDRRGNKVEESHKISGGSSNNTFERVEVQTQDDKDRIYVWTHPPHGAGSSKEESKVEHDMYWMQDADTEKEDETVALINQYLADPAEAIQKATGGEAGAAASAMDTDHGPAASGTTSTDQAQVDALSSILENLGMPQGGSSGGTGAGGTANTLTQADLAAAMAGIQQETAGGAPGGVVTSLSDVVTPAALRELLLQGDDALQQRLLALLPEGQQSKEYLEENLQSPQLQATLRSLSAALLPDRATGNLDGFLSLLANFEYEPPADMTAAATNPIQTFLECVLAKVEKDKQEEEEETKDEEEKTGEDEEKQGE